MTAALEGGEWSAARPGRTLPTGKNRYPLYRSLGGPQSRSGRAENLVSTGIRFRTVQPVAQSLHRLSYPTHTYTYTYMSVCVRVCIYIYMHLWEMWKISFQNISLVAQKLTDICRKNSLKWNLSYKIYILKKILKKIKSGEFLYQKKEKILIELVSVLPSVTSFVVN